MYVTKKVIENKYGKKTTLEELFKIAAIIQNTCNTHYYKTKNFIILAIIYYDLWWSIHKLFLNL